MKTFNHTYLIVIFFAFISNHLFAASNKSCESLKADFATIYTTLQQSLNYEGKDAVYVKGRGLQLKKHDGGEYQGKLFEDMLFSQYQNSLKKVGALLIQNGKLANSNETYKENEIIAFFKSIDPNFDLNKYPDIDGLVNKLAAKSAETFKDAADKNKVINNEDKYLLAKLLIHTRDRICTVEKAKTKKGKVDQKIIDIANSPLNRMVTALKNAQIKGNEAIQDIKNSDDILGAKTKINTIKLNANGDLESVIVEDNKAIKSAVLDNLHAFEKWMSAHKSCISFFKQTNGRFIQGVQSCNFQKFMDSIAKENNGISDFEKILHFINANQKSKLKAETNLDPLKLENYIDSAIKTSLVPNCEKIGTTVFARNLKYNGKSFDPTENNFKCSKNGTTTDCSKAIELISDEFGRGIQIKPKANNIKFSIPNSNCNDDLANEESPTPDNSGSSTITNNDTEESCNKINKILDQDTKKCRDLTDTERNNLKNQKDENCAKEDKIYDSQLNGCRPPSDNELSGLLVLRQNICKKEDKIYDEKTKSCIKSGEDSTITTPDTSRDQTPIVNGNERARTDGAQVNRNQSEEIKKCEKQSQKFDTATKKCRAYTDEELKQELPRLKINCFNQGKIFDEKKKECREMSEEELKVNLPILKDNCRSQNKIYDETKKECREMNDEEKAVEAKKAECAKDNKDYDEVTKSCKDKTATPPTSSAAEEECRKKNEEVSAANNGRPSTDWIVDNGKCINKKDKKDGKGNGSANEGDNPKDSFQDFLNSLGTQTGQPAPRFQPTNIPTRQVYILPGMP